jgi:hypothetical protein
MILNEKFSFCWRLCLKNTESELHKKDMILNTGWKASSPFLVKVKNDPDAMRCKVADNLLQLTEIIFRIYTLGKKWKKKQFLDWLL